MSYWYSISGHLVFPNDVAMSKVEKAIENSDTWFVKELEFDWDPDDKGVMFSFWHSDEVGHSTPDAITDFITALAEQFNATEGYTFEKGDEWDEPSESYYGTHADDLELIHVRKKIADLQAVEQSILKRMEITA
jgi:hypothetical protein